MLHAMVWLARGGASTKIHAAIDAYGYPVYIMISEGQRNDINFAIPVLEDINIEGSSRLADRGYDSNKRIDYIYEKGGEPTIPSRKGAKFERLCDWWVYKERHLAENKLPFTTLYYYSEQRNLSFFTNPFSPKINTNIQYSYKHPASAYLKQQTHSISKSCIPSACHSARKTALK